MLLIGRRFRLAGPLRAVLSPDRKQESSCVRPRLRCNSVVTAIAQSQVAIYRRIGIPLIAGVRVPNSIRQPRPTGCLLGSLIKHSSDGPGAFGVDWRSSCSLRSEALVVALGSGEPLIPVFALTGANTGIHSHVHLQWTQAFVAVLLDGRSSSGEEIVASFLCENYPPPVESSNRIRRVIAPAPISRPSCTFPNPDPCGLATSMPLPTRPSLFG